MSGIRNTMGDLNDHLFAALERLGDEGLEGEALEAEIERSKAVAEIGRAAIENANLVLRAAQFQENRLSDGELPRMLGDGRDA
jgi:hypothetical protein